MADNTQIDNMRGGTQRVIMVDSIDNTQGGTQRVFVVNAGDMGDQHNLGYYATLSALQEAHPTAEAGDFAVVGATDTVWIWDTDTSAWVDSDQKGQVTSVNGQTGAVTVQETLVSGTNIKTINNSSILGSGNLDIDALPSQTGQSGKFLTTDGTDASWANFIDDTSTSSLTTTWSANKLNSTVGDIETLLAAI